MSFKVDDSFSNQSIAGEAAVEKKEEAPIQAPIKTPPKPVDQKAQEIKEKISTQPMPAGERSPNIQPLDRSVTANPIPTSPQIKVATAASESNFNEVKEMVPSEIVKIIPKRTSSRRGLNAEIKLKPEIEESQSSSTIEPPKLNRKESFLQRTKSSIFGKKTVAAKNPEEIQKFIQEKLERLNELKNKIASGEVDQKLMDEILEIISEIHSKGDLSTIYSSYPDLDKELSALISYAHKVDPSLVEKFKDKFDDALNDLKQRLDVDRSRSEKETQPFYLQKTNLIKPFESQSDFLSAYSKLKEQYEKVEKEKSALGEKLKDEDKKLEDSSEYKMLLGKMNDLKEKISEMDKVLKQLDHLDEKISERLNHNNLRQTCASMGKTLKITSSFKVIDDFELLLNQTKECAVLLNKGRDSFKSKVSPQVVLNVYNNLIETFSHVKTIPKLFTKLQPLILEKERLLNEMKSIAESKGNYEAIVNDPQMSKLKKPLGKALEQIHDEKLTAKKEALKNKRNDQVAREKKEKKVVNVKKDNREELANEALDKLLNSIGIIKK